MHSRVFCRLSAHQSGTRGGSGVVVAAALGHGGGQAGVAGAHNEHFGLLVPVDVGRI